MANPPRNRKRVRALRRAPDGSAFQKCDECGASVAVALMDMHDCQLKKNVKKLKPKCGGPVDNNNTISEEPRSAFQYFLESYMETCKGGDVLENDRKAFEKWKTMSHEERWPYVYKAHKAEKAYMKVLHQEVEKMSQEDDDEADSAMVGKFTQDYEDSENSGSFFADSDSGVDLIYDLNVFP